MSALEGKTLNRYELLRLVGRGGMANVYEGYDAHFQRKVAVKVFKREDENMLQRFMREARLMASLNNPHLVPIYDVGESQVDGFTRYYIVMPFMEGGTLRVRIRRSPLTLAEACSCLQDIADALDYIHARGIIHRDIKASNVLLDAAGNFYLTDLGIARVVTDATQLTSTGNVLGTVDYLAPELFEPNRKSDIRSDLYSLGVVLFEMVTGQLPFSAENQIALVSMHINMPPPSPRLFVPNLSPQVEWVMLKALEKNPELRYASASEMAESFCQAVAASSNNSVQEKESISHVRPGGFVLPPVADNPSWPDSSPAAIGNAPVGGMSSLNKGAEGLRIAAPPHNQNLPAQKIEGYPPADSVDVPRQRRHSPLVAFLALIVLIVLLVPLVYTLVPRAGNRNGTIVKSITPTSTSAVRNSPTSRPTPTPNLTATALAAIAATATAHANATAAAIAAATATVQAQATATAGVILTATSGKPAYQDALNNANNPNTKAANWDQDSHCTFQSDGYHVLEGSGVHGCKESANTYQNMAITVDMRILSGHSGGIFFRVNTDIFNDYSGYLFEVDSTGRYKISSSQDFTLNFTILQDWTTSSALKKGTATNTLQVIAQGSGLSFYANGVFLVRLTSTTFSAGGVVAFLASSGGTSTEVVYSNLKIYPLS